LTNFSKQRVSNFADADILLLLWCFSMHSYCWW